ncbi:MAG TPA: PD-(D/E)XK nuclease family protein, partial [Solirubrobacteraceae bacterium]|nr:PD-(D/E)XK nuclease family protein [Solirubrobacteraceae bacterium]
ERRGEDLRLAYVALTRARHQAVVWWAGSWDSKNSPLGRLLFARDGEGNVAPRGSATPTDDAMLARLRELADDAAGCIAVEEMSPSLPTSWSQALPDTPVLATAAFDRDLDLRWRRTSYTDITSGAHDQPVASESEEPLIGDEPDEETPVVEASDGLLDADLALRAPSLLAEMPFGAEVGTFVHGVLEAADFAAADLDGELDAQIAVARAARGTEIGDASVVRAGLRASIETPLGPLAQNARLCEFDRRDRLDELAFELPLAGGDQPHGWATLSAIASVLRRHVRPEDPLAAYAERLTDPALRQRVRGYLTGSLDLVVRQAGGRFLICDYKTNWLAGPEEPLTAWHHRPAALAREMQRRHYGLQALLYTVALHRYLRWRLPAYDPDRHLGGVLYLFLRGMLGASTPLVDGQPCGVFAWRPPAGLVCALSDLLDEGTP